MFITFLFFGCSSRLYKITTYNKQTVWDLSNITKFKWNSDDSYSPSLGNYEAKKIISYDDIIVRFMDLKGNEQFVSGDKVEVKEIK